MTGTLEPGEVLAGYRILAMLGRGGMGTVYRAEDMRLRRHVALKVLSPAFANDDTFRERFDRESRLLASIEHPNIVDVFHADQVDGLSFLVMRLIDGPDLGALLAGGQRLERAAVAHIVTEVARALDKAHAHGLVHRDVKPGNILLAGQGPPHESRVYLSDFGLTKSVAEASPLTSTGQFLGTVDYVAPEQIQGTDVDGRADLYALACVAYECLAGHPPFSEARDAAALMAHLVTRPPDIAAVRPDLPAAVSGVLQWGMAKNRDQRPQTCAQFAAALGESLQGTAPAAAAAATAAAPAPPGAGPAAATTFAPPASALEATVVGGRPYLPPPPVAPPPSSPTIMATAPIVRPPSARRRPPEYGVSRGPRSRSRGSGGALGAAVLAVLLVAGIGFAYANGLFGLGPTPTGPAAASASVPASIDTANPDERLRALIPAALRAQCVAEAPSQPALAVQRCTLDGGVVEVRYRLYADPSAMDQAYEQTRIQLGVAADSGPSGNRCNDVAVWPNEGPYTVRNTPTGRLLCTLVAGPAHVEWTDRRGNVLTSAIDRTGDGRRVYRFWRDGRLPPPTGQPGNTAQPALTEAPLVTDPPASTEPPPPTAQPSDAGGEGSPTEQLRGHIPAALRPQCVAEAPAPPVLAVQHCTADDGAIEATYALYADGQQMSAAFEEARTELGVEPDSGQAGSRCAEPADWPAEGQYTISGQPAGRLVCAVIGSDARLVWTDTRLDILTSAVDHGGDGARLYEFWRDRGGPVE